MIGAWLNGDGGRCSKQFLFQAALWTLCGLSHEEQKINPSRLTDAPPVFLKDFLLLALRK